MAATTPIAFDPDPIGNYSAFTFTAASAILAGQIVAFAATGVSRTVAPATSSLSAPIGVAQNTAATGEAVSVLLDGTICKVMLSADNGTADAGDWLSVSTVAGCAIVADTAIAVHDSQATGLYPIGVAIDDIAAGADTVGGTGYVILRFAPIYTAAS